MKADGIQLVVSDVDGTLATSDKTFTAATVAAVGRLRAAGIGFTIASARPPIGLRNLVATLGLDLPMGAYNGATVVGPDLAVGWMSGSSPGAHGTCATRRGPTRIWNAAPSMRNRG